MQNRSSSVVKRSGLKCPIKRYYLSMMICIGYTLAYSTRVNLSVAILFMTEKRRASMNGTITVKQEFQWNEIHQAYLLSSFFFGYIATQIPGGWLAGVIGGTNVLLIGVTGSGLLSFVAPLAAINGYPILLSIRFCCGLIQGLVIPASYAIWVNWAPPLERTILSGIAISGNFLSPLAVMPVCGAIGKNWGWEWTFYFFGILSCLWGLAWYLTIAELPGDDKFIKRNELNYIIESIGEKPSTQIIHPWSQIFKSLAVWAVIVAQFGYNWSFFTVLLYGPKFYKDTENYELMWTMIYSGSGNTICGLLILVFSKVSDVIRTRKLLSTKNVRKMFTCVGFFLQAVFMLILSFSRVKVLTIVAMTVSVGLGGITYIGFYVNPLDIASHHAAVIVAISNSFGSLPGIMTPFIINIFIPHENPNKSDWIEVWLICAILYVCAALFFFIFAQGEKQPWAFSENTK